MNQAMATVSRQAQTIGSELSFAAPGVRIFSSSPQSGVANIAVD